MWLSRVPRLSWNANIYHRDPHLHDFNVCILERGSLGTRLHVPQISHSGNEAFEALPCDKSLGMKLQGVVTSTGNIEMTP